MYCSWYRSSTCKEGKARGVLVLEGDRNAFAQRSSQDRDATASGRGHVGGGLGGTLLELLDDQVDSVSLGQRTVRRYAGSTEKGSLEIGEPSMSD